MNKTITEKKCSLCNQIKPISHFYKMNQYFYPQCKECKRLKDKNTYHSNPNEKNRRKLNDRKARRIRRLKAQIFVYQILSNSKCIDCGESRFETLEFDHVIGVKQQNISLMISKGLDLKIIEDEISKCEIRCANCHRIKTQKTLGWIRARWNFDDAESELYFALAERKNRNKKNDNFDYDKSK